MSRPLTRLRHPSRALGLQVAAVLVLSVLLAAWSWRLHDAEGRLAEAVEVELPAVVEAIHDAAEAGLAAALDDDADAPRQADRALTRARVGLERVGRDEPAGRQALAALDALDEAILAQRAGHLSPREVRERLAAAEDVALAATRALSGRLAHQRDALRTTWRTGVAVLWVALVLAVGVTALATLRLAAVEEAVARRTIDRHARAIADALTRAVRGEAPRPLPDDPLLAPLVNAAASAIRTLHELRGKNRHIARTSRFVRELVDALSLADTEAEVWATARRAVARIAPDLELAPLIVEEDERVRPFDEATRPACGVEHARRCAAARRGRAVHHGPPGSLGRCPLLDEAVPDATCAPVSDQARTAALVQVAGPRLPRERLGEIDVLVLAVGARLQVVRSLAARAHEAETDPLTGLPNRRALEARLRALDERGEPYAILALDVDHFKRLNDRHGHPAGDACLVHLAGVLRAACRDSDLPARTGGEEFTVILPGAGSAAGEAVARRIRSLLAGSRPAGTPAFTVSIGVAARGEHGADAEAVRTAADRALYAAKAAGRDRVAHATPNLSLVGAPADASA